MMDAFRSEPLQDSVAAARFAHGRLIIGAVAALMIVAGASAWRMASGPPPVTSAAMKPSEPARNPVLDELVEATKALEISQQQAIDQLQELQQLFAAQQADARKSSAEVAALSDQIEALRRSFASAPVPSPEQADEPEPKLKQAVVRSRGRTHRTRR